MTDAKTTKKTGKYKYLKWLAILVFGSLALWLIASLYLVWVSPSQIFFQERSYNVEIKNTYQQEFVENKFGENIDLWYLPKDGAGKVVLYLHGNSGRIPHFFTDISDLGYSILSPAYPGYHLSEGSPSTENVYNTAEVAYDWLVKEGWSEQDIIILGHSMGGSPAVYLASKKPNRDRLIIVNTFSSVYSMCQAQYSILCIFGQDILPSDKYAKKVEGEVVQFAFKGDDVVPFKEGEKLFEAFKTDKKKFVELDSQTHSYFDMQEVLETQVEN